MADITDPIVIKWANEDLRTLAENVLVTMLKCQEFVDQYNDTIAALITGNVNADPLADNREAEGVSRLTKADLVAFGAVVSSIATLADGPTRTTVRLPTVRKISIGV